MVNPSVFPCITASFFLATRAILIDIKNFDNLIKILLHFVRIEKRQLNTKNLLESSRRLQIMTFHLHFTIAPNEVTTLPQNEGVRGKIEQFEL